VDVDVGVYVDVDTAGSGGESVGVDVGVDVDVDVDSAGSGGESVGVQERARERQTLAYSVAHA